MLSMFNIGAVYGEQTRDFSHFLELPDGDEEHRCYEAFYDATSNEALTLCICPVCARERLGRDGEEMLLLSNPSVVELLTMTFKDEEGQDRVYTPVLQHLVRNETGTVICWMCFDCITALERHTLPKLSLANNLWIGDIPQELVALTVPEQLLIGRHYPRCYVFKLFPRDIDAHVSMDQLYSGMAGNATLFDLNTQEVVQMLEGQRMPSPVASLASVIAITFVSSRNLPMDWLKKTFRVRRQVVYDALLWLKLHNPIYADIRIDESQLALLPEDDMPNELLAIVRHERDDDLAEKEGDSYLFGENMIRGDDEEPQQIIQGKNIRI